MKSCWFHDWYVIEKPTTWMDPKIFTFPIKKEVYPKEFSRMQKAYESIYTIDISTVTSWDLEIPVKYGKVANRACRKCHKVELSLDKILPLAVDKLLEKLDRQKTEKYLQTKAIVVRQKQQRI